MSLTNLSGIVDQLGLSFSCIIARRDLLSFSINQLNLLKNVSRKFSQIDLLDKNYPSNDILVKFLRNGFRVLEESLSLMNNGVNNFNLPHSLVLSGTTQNSLANHQILTHPSNDNSKQDLNNALTRLERVLNDSLISFFCSIGNSGLFLHNLNYLSNVLNHINIKSLSYTCLVCVVGIISKCDLFRLNEFLSFSDSIFSYFCRNLKALRYLNDLDTTLLLFHKIATLYMAQPRLSSTNTFNGYMYQMKHIEQLLTLLGVSIEKVSQIVDYRPVELTSSVANKHMKSLNNLIQSLFLIHEYDSDLIFKLPMDKLDKLCSILSENDFNQQFQYTSESIGSDSSKSNINTYNLDNNLHKPSFLHLKIKNVLASIINPTHTGTNNTKGICNVNNSHTSSNGVNYMEDAEYKGVKNVLSEIRVGSSLYFIDLLIV